MDAKVTVVKVKGHGIKWAQKCVPDGAPDKPRFRGYFYKREAISGLDEWDNYPDMERNYWHNFHSADELGIKEA